MHKDIGKAYYMGSWEIDHIGFPENGFKRNRTLCQIKNYSWGPGWPASFFRAEQISLHYFLGRNR